MKKRFVSLISIAISCVILFSSNTTVFASGYGDGGGVNTNAGVTAYTERGEYTGGLHTFVATETAKKIVNNGETEYKIVYAANADSHVKTAVSEFSSWFAVATGNTLQKEKDDVATYSSSAKYFCIGENNYSAAANVTEPSNLKTNGYIIKTVGDSVIVLGGTGLGTIFGVYGLLNHLFGLEFYGSDSYYTRRNVNDLKLYNYNVVDNPDVNINIAAYGNIYYNAIPAYRLGYVLQYQDVFMYPDRAFHNSLYYLDPEIYYSQHSDWYSGIDKVNGQLCYTAHGNTSEYNKMVDTMVEEVKPYIIAEPDKTLITITQQDNTNWCGCSACQSVINTYGAKSATQVRFINDVAEKIENWLKVAYPGREKDVKILMFAYHATLQPPTKGNLKLRDNAMIYIAPYGATDFALPYEAETNQGAKAVFDGWARVANHTGVWAYQTFYDYYIVPLNNWGALQDHWKQFATMNSFVVFNQGQQNNNAPTGFSALKVYLNGKYGRNVNLNSAELIDNFFEYYYGKKDGYMRKFYDELNLYMSNLRANGTHGKSLYQSAISASLFPFNIVNKWNEYCNKAIEEISNLRSIDQVWYNSAVKHIMVESLFPRYFIAKYHIGYYNKTEQAEIRRQFALDCKSLDMNMDNEGTKIDGLIDGWL